MLHSGGLEFSHPMSEQLVPHFVRQMVFQLPVRNAHVQDQFFCLPNIGTKLAIPLYSIRYGLSTCVFFPERFSVMDIYVVLFQASQMRKTVATKVAWRYF